MIEQPSTTIYHYYLAGPMAGYPEHNHPAFHEAAAKLRGCGHAIVSPAEYGNLAALGRNQCMKRDIHALMWCEAVIVLPGWECSPGATMETNLATDLGMPVFHINVMLCDCIYTEPANPDSVWHTESCVDRRIPLPVPTIHRAYHQTWKTVSGAGYALAHTHGVVTGHGGLSKAPETTSGEWPDWYPANRQGH